MVRQAMLIGGHSRNLRYHPVVLDHHADHPRRIRFENQGNHVEHGLDPTDEVRGVWDVGGKRRINDRLRPLLPGLDLGQILLGRPHGVEVGVQLLLVACTHAATQRCRLRFESIEDAAAIVEALRLARDLLGRPLQKHLPEQLSRTGLSRHHRTTPGKGLALRGHGRQDHRRKPRDVAEMVGDYLVDRNRIPKPIHAWTPSRRQPGDF